MSIQGMMDSLNHVMQSERSKYHLTLGKLINALENASLDDVVKFSDGSYPSGFISYRGYYCDLAIESMSEPITVVDLHTKCIQEVLDQTFEGYKGGDFLMTEKTPLWKDEYGECNNVGIMGVDFRPGEVILVVKQLEV